MKYLTVILLLSTLFSCKQPEQKTESEVKYFEGFVEFQNTYQTGDDSRAPGKKPVAVKTVAYLGKDGFFAREFVDSNNIIINREIYRPDSLKTFYFNNDSDTILAYDVTRNKSSELVSVTKNSGLKILGDKVDIITVKRLVRLIGTDSVYYVFTTYYNDPKYHIQPLTYKCFLRHSVKDVFSSSPFISVGYKTMRNNKITYLSIATRIVQAHVPSWHFEIPRNKIIIEQ
ncbi:MAG TPA: hypothetical protein VG738_17585 [Chitinophagaceae bacterium]|nr:hypothetical protein [Chitinophagaceae bacterium]